AVSAAQAALTRALAALGLPDITEEFLRSMKLPSLERVSAFRANRQEIAGEEELARSRMEEAKETAGELELQVTQFERSHKVITAGEVSGARRERDDKWGAIKSGTLVLSEGAPQLDIAIRLADELVDARTLSETDSVTLQGLRDQLETASDAHRRHTKTFGDKEQELQEFDARWAEVIAQMGLDGMELDDMPEWLAKRETALAAAENHAGKKHEFEQERDSAVQTRNDLAAAMTAAGLPVSEASGLVALCMSADEHIKTIDRARGNRESVQQQLRDAQSSLRLAEQTKNARTTAVHGWNTKWQEALNNANLGSVTNDFAEVEAAIEAASFIRQRLEKIDTRRVERIVSMEADLELLKSAGLALAHALNSAM